MFNSKYIQGGHIKSVEAFHRIVQELEKIEKLLQIQITDSLKLQAENLSNCLNKIKEGVSSFSNLTAEQSKKQMAEILLERINNFTQIISQTDKLSLALHSEHIEKVVNFFSSYLKTIEESNTKEKSIKSDKSNLDQDRKHTGTAHYSAPKCSTTALEKFVSGIKEKIQNVSFHIVGNEITRVGLFSNRELKEHQSKAKKLFDETIKNNSLFTGFCDSIEISNGDCFYASLATALNCHFGKDSYDVKKIRLLFSGYVKNKLCWYEPVSMPKNENFKLFPGKIYIRKKPETEDTLECCFLDTENQNYVVNVLLDNIYRDIEERGLFLREGNEQIDDNHIYFYLQDEEVYYETYKNDEKLIQKKLLDKDSQQRLNFELIEQLKNAIQKNSTELLNKVSKEDRNKILDVISTRGDITLKAEKEKEKKEILNNLSCLANGEPENFIYLNEILRAIAIQSPNININDANRLFPTKNEYDEYIQNVQYTAIECDIKGLIPVWGSLTIEGKIIFDALPIKEFISLTINVAEDEEPLPKINQEQPKNSLQHSEKSANIKLGLTEGRHFVPILPINTKVESTAKSLIIFCGNEEHANVLAKTLEESGNTTSVCFFEYKKFFVIIVYLLDIGTIFKELKENKCIFADDFSTKKNRTFYTDEGKILAINDDIISLFKNTEKKIHSTNKIMLGLSSQNINYQKFRKTKKLIDNREDNYSFKPSARQKELFELPSLNEQDRSFLKFFFETSLPSYAFGKIISYLTLGQLNVIANTDVEITNAEQHKKFFRSITKYFFNLNSNEQEQLEKEPKQLFRNKITSLISDIYKFVPKDHHVKISKLLLNQQGDTGLNLDDPLTYFVVMLTQIHNLKMADIEMPFKIIKEFKLNELVSRILGVVQDSSLYPEILWHVFSEKIEIGQKLEKEGFFNTGINDKQRMCVIREEYENIFDSSSSDNDGYIFSNPEEVNEFVPVIKIESSVDKIFFDETDADSADASSLYECIKSMLDFYFDDNLNRRDKFLIENETALKNYQLSFEQIKQRLGSTNFLLSLTLILEDGTKNGYDLSLIIIKRAELASVQKQIVSQKEKKAVLIKCVDDTIADCGMEILPDRNVKLNDDIIYLPNFEVDNKGEVTITRCFFTNINGQQLNSDKGFKLNIIEKLPKGCKDLERLLVSKKEAYINLTNKILHNILNAILKEDYAHKARYFMHGFNIQKNNQWGWGWTEIDNKKNILGGLPWNMEETVLVSCEKNKDLYFSLKTGHAIDRNQKVLSTKDCKNITKIVLLENNQYIIYLKKPPIEFIEGRNYKVTEKDNSILEYDTLCSFLKMGRGLPIIHFSHNIKEIIYYLKLEEEFINFRSSNRPATEEIIPSRYGLKFHICLPEVYGLQIMPDNLKKLNESVIYLPDSKADNNHQITITKCFLVNVDGEELKGDQAIMLNITKKIPESCKSLKELLTSSDIKFVRFKEELLNDILLVTSKAGHTDPEEKKKKFNLGWKLICLYLMKQEVNHFKIVYQAYKMSDNPQQAGKDITIYADKNPDFSPQKWCDIIYQITILLVNYNIEPGFKQLSDEKRKKKEEEITGSSYFSYRYDYETPETDELKFIKVSDIEGQKEPRIYFVNPIEEMPVENEEQNNRINNEETNKKTGNDKGCCALY